MPFRMYRENTDIDSEILDTRLSELFSFNRAVQVCAVWSDSKRNGEENYRDFFNIMEKLEKQAEINKEKCIICTDRNILESESVKVKLIPAVEGADLLCGDIERLKKLYERGVRILTFAWKGENELCGAHDTDTGLKDFGKAVLAECEKLKITVDTSHMSERAFWDIISEAKAPIIASHSNSAHICGCTRNLTDTQFCAITACGGVVGINLYPPFISRRFESNTHDPDEYLSALCGHIEHFLSLGGENSICLGGDRDGFDRIPGYSPLSFADKIYEKLLKSGIKEKIIKNIFSVNALHFFERALPL